MNTFQLILLIALAVVVAVKSEAECTYGDKTYKDGDIIYKDPCSYCICNEAGELSDCGTDADSCGESCEEGLVLTPVEGQCCSSCLPVGGN